VKTLTSFDPATGDVVGEVPVASAADVREAVTRARAAQPAWEELGVEGRAALLAKAAPILLENVEEHAMLITREMGKPLRESRIEARSLGSGLERELGEMVEALRPETLEEGGVRSTIHHDPLGVVGAITPWNFPMSMPSWMVVPSLAAGNTVVLKPSEETPLCGQAYADALGEVLPPDVLLVVHGADETGKAVVASEVDMIAFTGSREVGKLILRAASDSLKRVVLELGGKDPLIVLEDAHVGEAAKFAAYNSFRNCGQVCVSTERIFVHEAVADEFERALTQLAAAMRVGRGLEDPDVGPMVSQRQRAHVLAQIEAAVSSGARLLVGGNGGEGNFVAPTVLADVSDEMDIATAETFGPVACVTRVASADEAVARANDTRFGLGAVVFGAEGEATERVARKLTAGMVGVNRGVFGVAGSPWVGARESGFGFHKGRDGHRQFTQTRVVTRAS
jgi:acyl-CoA reductase-like NAD-dependent aldehyde dehydrogenase